MSGNRASADMLAMALGCDDNVIAALLRHGRMRAVGRRQCLVQQGDLLNTIWLVVEGQLKIESAAANGRMARLALSGPGEWVGGYAQPVVSQADIVATQPSRLLAFPSGLLPRLAHEHATIGAALALSFSRQLDHMVARLDARANLSAKGRVCAELLNRAGTGLRISPPPVIAELALAVQTTRETASRTVAELERRGIVCRRDHALEISSPRMLREMVV